MKYVKAAALAAAMMALAGCQKPAEDTSKDEAAIKAVDTGKYIGVFQKKEGKWLYIRDTWNSDNAPVTAAPAPASEAPPAGG